MKIQKIIFSLALSWLYLAPSISKGESEEYFYSYGKYLDLENFLSLVPPTRPSGPPFNGVVAKYGPTVVKAGFFEAIASFKPWSSWWYPATDKIFFDESNGPGTSILGRYDNYVINSGKTNPMSRELEETKIYTTSAASWEGMCDAWSMASIMEKEPVKEVTLKGVDFRIQDLKALLIKSYEESKIKEYYGQRNNARWDSIHEDIYPEQFHRFIQVEVFQKKLPFLMDIDAGYQVWNVPVYKIQTTITKDPRDKEVVHVKTWAHYASPFIKDRDFVGTQSVFKSYTYDLHGKWNSKKEFVVDYGIWVESSRWDHPDFVVPKPDFMERKLKNTNLDLGTIDEIVNLSRI